MKIFALYLRLNITQKPKWFDDVRAKYSSNSILHITLIQPRHIDENRIDSIKEIVKDTLEQVSTTDQDKRIVFSKTELEEDEGDYILMSFFEENKFIRDLQKDLREKLEEFNDYCDDKTREYELNFRPHLTIGSHIDFQSKENISKLISEDNRLKGNIRDLVLAVVKEQTVDEAENPGNWVIFTV